MWGDIKAAFRKGDLLEDIKQTNADLSRLVEVRPLDPTKAPSRQAPFASHYNRVNRHATSLFDYLYKSFQVDPVCSCGSHDANLILQRAQVHTKNRPPLPVLKFAIFFSRPAAKDWEWRDFIFESIEGCEYLHGSDKPDPTSEELDAESKTEDEPKNAMLGEDLLPTKKHWYEKQNLGFWNRKSNSDTRLATVASTLTGSDVDNG